MAFPTESGDPKLCGGIWGFGIFDNGDEAKIKAAKTFIDFMLPTPIRSRTASGFHLLPRPHQRGRHLRRQRGHERVQQVHGPYLGDYYQITPGWATARTEWWNMLQRVGSGEDVTTAVKTFVDNANAAAAAEA